MARASGHVRRAGAGSDSADGGIAWVPYAISHALDPLYTHFLNQPTGTDILWSTPTALVVTLLWPITALFGTTVTYDLVITLSLALAAFFAYLVIRRWVPGGVVAPAVGGLMYGFSPFMTGQLIGHYNLVLSGVTPPLALMLADEILVRQRLRPRTLGLLAALLAVVQFFIAQEFLLTEFIVGVILAVVLAISHRDVVRAHIGFIARSLAWAAVPAVVLLACPTWLQLFGADHVVTPGALHGTDIDVTASHQLRCADRCPADQSAGGHQHLVALQRQRVRMGRVPDIILLLVLATVRFWKMPAIRTAGLLALIIAVLSSGPHLNVQKHVLLALPLPWWIPAHIPVLDDILPNRLMVYVDLAAAVIVAFSLRLLWVLRRSPVAQPGGGCRRAPPARANAARAGNPHQHARSVRVHHPFPDRAGRHRALRTLPERRLLARDGMAWASAGFAFRLVGGYIIGPYAPGVELLQGLIDSIAATYDISYSVPTITVTDDERSEIVDARRPRRQ